PSPSRVGKAGTRCAPHHAQCGTHCQTGCDTPRPVPGRASAHPAPCLRHAPAGRRRRPSRHSGTAGPRAPLDHAALHPAHRLTAHTGLRPHPPARPLAIPTSLLLLHLLLLLLLLVHLHLLLLLLFFLSSFAQRRICCSQAPSKDLSS